MSDPSPLLFQPLKLRNLTLTNRVVISPMCQHAADRGHATPWHMVHLGKFALGGAGLILTESTAVDPRGRIGTADLGLWKDSQIAPLKAVVDFVHAQGSAIGVQLAHAGRKAGSEPLWEGGAALSAERMAADEEPWERLGPSTLAAGPGWSAPRALDANGIASVVKHFVDATVRADKAGFDVVELHFGHGYLVASFLSPNANHRGDALGGSREHRMWLALEIAQRVRAAWPAGKPLFCRLSAVDGTLDGWSLDDSVILARELKRCGVDVIDCSSGGLTEETRALPVLRGLGFQVPFSERIRRDAQIATQAVGMIVDAQQAEAVLASGQADLIALGREALFDPYWPHHAAAELGADPGYERWPVRHGVWLAKRAPGLARARAEAATVQRRRHAMTATTSLRMGLIRKKPDWTDEAFRSHWRDSHGPLVARLPALRAYRQNLVVDRLQRGIDFARGPWDFDGFSQLRFDEAARAHQAFTQGDLALAIRADEEHFLGGLHIVSVEQTEVIALPAKPEGLLKRISLLRRPVAQSEEDFRREWKVHAEHVRRMPGVSGYRQNVVVAREFEKGTPCNYAELPIDGIVELWFENTDTLNAAFASPQGQRTMAHARTFLAEITAFVVEEHRVA